MWLFALLAYDGLSAVPDLLWGIPLVAASGYLILFTVYKCREDINDLNSDIKQNEEEAKEAEGEERNDPVQDSHFEGALDPDHQTAEEIPRDVEATPPLDSVEGEPAGAMLLFCSDVACR